jgi:hypothetical protein
MTATANPIPVSDATQDRDAAEPVAAPVLTQKSTAAACGIPAISATVHAAEAANPVSPADTHDTGSAFGATHAAHLVGAEPGVLIAACCHRFPAESVTFTAGTGMTAPGVSVFQPARTASHDPACVVIAVVPIPEGVTAEPGTCCSTDGNGHRLPCQPGISFPVGRPEFM